MKKLFVTVVLFLSAMVVAQDKFIEVEVGDTITLRPERFEYVIKIYLPDTTAVAVEEGLPYGVEAEKKKYADKKEQLRKLLQKYKYIFRPVTADNDRGDMDFYTATGFIVTLKNEKEFLDVQKLIQKIDYAYGSFGEVKYANEQKAEEDLYGKLLVMARAKAVIIATASGLKAGSVIAVTEVEGMGDLDLNIHDTYFVTRGTKNLEMRDGKLVGSLYKKLVVRFAAE